jgi:hypothetical protein
MYIYRDIFSGDELVTDTFRMKDVDNTLWEVEGKFVTLRSENDFDIGANASAEEKEEELESTATQVINVVHSTRLTEFHTDKKGYMNAIKNYMKRVKEHLEKTKPDRVEQFQKSAAEQVKKIIAEFDDYVFYTGESMDSEAMIVFCKYSADGLTPTFYFWKDGLKEEKV